MRYKGKIAGSLIVSIVVVVVLVLAGLGIYISGYNKAINLDEATNNAWADVDAALQRRLDLIPNLVNTVKGYASHEREIFEHVADARTKYFSADSREDKMAASNELSQVLSRLLMLTENYPDLKANQNFLTLQDQLEGSENRITVARTRYNGAARQLNSYTRQFVGSFFARKAGVEAVKYFEADQTAAQAPQVSFE